MQARNCAKWYDSQLYSVSVTKKTAISLPDDLYRAIERARRRSGRDRSTWIQEAASEYLKKRTKEQEIEAWLSAYEKVPLSADERALSKWFDEHLDERLDAAEGAPTSSTTRRSRKHSR